MFERRRSIFRKRTDAYWRANVRIIITVLLIWCAAAYLPPLFVAQLNQIVIGGFPLGYYMGSQGALIVFVMLSFYYGWRIDRLDCDHDVDNHTR